jgi:hypothetical protein
MYPENAVSGKENYIVAYIFEDAKIITYLFIQLTIGTTLDSFLR